MADPTPVVGLPNAEFVEIYNNSEDTISLLNWQLGDASGRTTIRTNYLLPPQQHLILCANNNVSLFTPFGPSLGITSFPSLNNDADQIVLIDPSGKIIHQVYYQIDRFKDDFKKQGGFTIELVDLSKPCLGEMNFQFSIDPSGGTPGRTNSVSKEIIDTLLPQIRNAFILDEQKIRILFNKNLQTEQEVQIKILSTISDFEFQIDHLSWINDQELIIHIKEYFSLQETYTLLTEQ